MSALRLRAGLGSLLLALDVGSAAVAHAEEAPSSGVASVAEAPSKEQCVDANGRAQELRRKGALALAREELRACVDPACPAIVRDDCTRRLDELEQAQPTIAFSVHDATGDLSDVTVLVDGKLLARQLDGSALPVDVGQHSFQFEAAGHTPTTRTLLVIEGEKLRRERVALNAPGALASVPADAAPEPRSVRSESPSLGPQKLSGLVSGGVGVVLLIGGVTFGALASSRWSDAEDACPSHTQCSPQAMRDRDTAAEYATVSTVGFITGGVLVALGVTLFLTAPKAAHTRLAAGFTPAGLRLRGTF